jgi:hypothetical protein
MDAMMRDDMDKVLVESPRSGRASAAAQVGQRRNIRNRMDRDGEGAITRIAMRHDGCKHFGEHLAPLYRYLQKQVNRPWAKVYGELCAGLDKRSVVQSHLFQHIDGKVEVNTVWKDDAVWVRSWRGLEPLSQARCEMYVHPRTGILLVNRARLLARREQRLERKAARVAASADRRCGLTGMPDDVQWHRCDGIWYEVRLGPLVAGSKERVYDIVLKKAVGVNSAVLQQRYGACNRYAVSKRQLDAKTLRRHGLVSRP